MSEYSQRGCRGGRVRGRVAGSEGSWESKGHRNGGQGQSRGRNLKARVKKLGWLLWGREGKGGCQNSFWTQWDTPHSLGISKQQPRAVTNVGTSLKDLERPGILKGPSTAFGKVRRHRWSQGAGN